jgi:aminoglycoside/choline kinase family phosphotransferase
MLIKHNEGQEYNMTNRQNALYKWLKLILGEIPFSITPVVGDASFRQYHRLLYSGLTRIVMDAPPDKESIHAFITVSRLFREHGIKTPLVHHADETLGFAILDDFGDQLFLNQLTESTHNPLYQSALTTLINLQKIPTSQAISLPPFDKQHCLNELHLFNQWFLEAYLGLTLTTVEKRLINQTFEWLSDAMVQHPRVIVHRDYHSRNIMILDTSPSQEDDHSNANSIDLGIIDFQDAMTGSFTYDLVSLLKDCYVQLPTDQIKSLLAYFYDHSTVAQQWHKPDFIRAFDDCGLQRHLKVLGVFSRLYLRDGKSGYLKDLPLTLHYVLSCLETYEELHPFYQFMQEKVKLP